MKKICLLFSVSALLSFSSCTEEAKNTRGKVSTIDDKSLVIVSTEGVEQTFTLENADYTNGAVMSGDSVDVTYTGNPQKDAKASEVALIIQSRTVTKGVDESKELIVR